MNRPLVAFGIVFLIVGLGSGYLIYNYPEGLNPDWPLWMAMLAPAVFALGGLHLIASGLDQPRLSSAMLGAIAVCLWAIVNWAAFFTSHIPCTATISFLDIPIFDWQPSEIECRNSLRAIVAGIDILVVIAAGFLAWQRYRDPRKDPGR
jgi:hypothetical protein